VGGYVGNLAGTYFYGENAGRYWGLAGGIIGGVVGYQTAPRVFNALDNIGMGTNGAGAGKTYSPIDPHPTLSKGVQDSFNGGTFTETVLAEDTTFYRVYGGNSGKVGSYMTRTPQNGTMQSQMDLALNPEWGNTATSVTKVTVPKGTVIYEGTAAPQGNLLGGGNQIYIPEVNASWFGN